MLGFAYQFMLGVQRHGFGGELEIQEGHARLDAVSHGHPVSTLQIDVLQSKVNTVELPLKRFGIGRVGKVHVSTKKLITPLASQAHLHLLGGVFRQKVVRDGRPDQLWLIRLEMVNYFINNAAGFISCKDTLTVVITKCLGDLTGGSDVWRVFHANTEGRQPLARGKMGFHECAYNARVDSAAEEQTELDVAHHALYHRDFKRLPQLLGRHVRVVLEVRLQERRLVELDEARLRGEEVAGGELIDIFGVALVHNHLQFGGDHQRPPVGSLGTSHVQRLDPNMITSSQESAVRLIHQDKGEHAPKVFHERRSKRAVQMQQHLRVGVALRLYRLGKGGVHVPEVVYLAVCHNSNVWLHEGLVSCVSGVHD
mmetsp:Transcript_35148/g.59157  ORF Transcript_35148/g.59157 Transcript_35148/m.59157 type:complete len:368 (+) Transcript_35148:2683-3786(+)